MITTLLMLCIGSIPLTSRCAEQQDQKIVQPVEAAIKTRAGQSLTEAEEKELFELIQRTMGTPVKQYFVESPGMSEILLERCDISQSGGIHPE